MQLSNPQGIFLDGLNTKFRAYVGGFGSGKTFVGCMDMMTFALANPGVIQGYFAPTYPAIRDIFYQVFDEVATLLGFRTDIKEANKEVHIYRGSIYYGTIICRSMDRPNSIIGFKIARAMVDEIDTIPKNKAAAVWNKIIARMRLMVKGVQNSIGVTTTPEGFLFVYNKFANSPTKSYSMVQASTYENRDNLPEDYIASLLETYPAALVEAYIGGQFVNLTSGTVYNAYDRIKNRSAETIQDKEPLRIGMDFNVQNMSGVIYVVRGKQWHAVGELKGIYDTPAMIHAIKGLYPEHDVTIYPDASGRSRKSVDASISDIGLLEQAGFHVLANKSNPLVKDRIIATNQGFIKGWLFVNDNECPDLARAFEQLPYDQNGVPDKSTGLDHIVDAATYPAAYENPVNKPMLVTGIQSAR